MTTKYQQWYDAIIERARERVLGVYKEKHHILPRSLGGGDETTNLVDLSYREHFLAHWLLIKIYDRAARQAMLAAFNAMTMPLGHRIVSSWQFEVVKQAKKNERLRRIKARRDQRHYEKPHIQANRIREARKKIETLQMSATGLNLRKHRKELHGMADDWIAAVRRGYNGRDRMIIKSEGIFPKSKVKTRRLRNARI